MDWGKIGRREMGPWGPAGCASMTTDNSVLAAISDSHIFTALDQAGRALLLDAATQVSFDAGQVVVREGDPGDALFVVKAGIVEVHTDREGSAVHLAQLGPGACYGEVSMLSGLPRTATVVAKVPSTLLRLPREQLAQLLDAYPNVRERLQTMVLLRATDTIKKITRPAEDGDED